MTIKFWVALLGVAVWVSIAVYTASIVPAIQTWSQFWSIVLLAVCILAAMLIVYRTGKK